jgi:hypothetical protein
MYVFGGLQRGYVVHPAVQPYVDPGLVHFLSNPAAMRERDAGSCVVV